MMQDALVSGGHCTDWDLRVTFRMKLEARKPQGAADLEGESGGMRVPAETTSAVRNRKNGGLRVQGRDFERQWTYLLMEIAGRHGISFRVACAGEAYCRWMPEDAIDTQPHPNKERGAASRRDSNRPVNLLRAGEESNHGR
jgi:hypothetical protein